MVGRKWHEDEVVGLLAWLDFSIKYKFSFEETIVQHLKQIAYESIGEYSEHTIFAILAKLFRRCGAESAESCSAQARKDIRAGGSRCIPELAPARIQAIKAATARYELTFLDRDGKVLPFLQSQSPQTSHDSKDQGGKFDAQGNPNTPSLLDIDDRTGTSSVHTFNKRTPRYGCRSSQKDVNPEERVSSRQGKALEKTACKSNSQVVADQPKEHRDCRPKASPGQAVQEQLSDELKLKVTELACVRKEWELETEQLHEQVVRLKEVELELRAENQHLILARQDRERVDRDYLEYEISQKNGQIWKLNNQLEKMRKLAVFAQHDSMAERTLNTDVVDQAIESISSALNELSVGDVSRKPLTVPNIAENAELGLLLQSLFGDVDDPGRETMRLKRCVLKYGTEVLVKCLCITAVRDWVFYSDFPKFAPADFRLLGAYRESVMVHDGWDRLRNLEVAAYHHLIDTQRFRTVLVPRKAHGLVDRFLRAGAPLVMTPQPEMQAKDLESWCQPGAADEDRRFRLKEIFEAALTLKAATVTTDQIFEFFLLPPGTPFNVQDANLGSAAGEETWTVASFHVYRGGKQVSGNTMTDALLKCRNFVVKSEKRRNESTEYKKVVVMQRQEEPGNLDEQGCKGPSDTGKLTGSGDQLGDKDTTHMRLQHPVTCHGCDEQHWSIQSFISHRMHNILCGPSLEVGDVLQQMVNDAEKEQNEGLEGQHAAPDYRVGLLNDGQVNSSTQKGTTARVVPPSSLKRPTDHANVGEVINKTNRTKSNERMAVDKSQREASESPVHKSSDSQESDTDDNSRVNASLPKDYWRELPTVVPDEDGKYDCPLCSKTYSAQGSMQRHWKTNHLCTKMGYHRISAKTRTGTGRICKDCNKVQEGKGTAKPRTSSLESSTTFKGTDERDDAKEQTPRKGKKTPTEFENSVETEQPISKGKKGMSKDALGAANSQKIQCPKNEKNEVVISKADKVGEHKRKRSKDDADADWRPSGKVARLSSV